jgi:hypothetical protein
MTIPMGIIIISPASLANRKSHTDIGKATPQNAEMPSVFPVAQT